MPSSSVLYLPITARSVATLFAASAIGSIISFLRSSDNDPHDVAPLASETPLDAETKVIVYPVAVSHWYLLLAVLKN